MVRSCRRAYSATYSASRVAADSAVSDIQRPVVVGNAATHAIERDVVADLTVAGRHFAYCAV